MFSPMLVEKRTGSCKTIANCLRTGQEIAVWGPYEVWHGAYYRFMVQKEFMESGRVGYQCIDTWGEAGRTGDGLPLGVQLVGRRDAEALLLATAGALERLDPRFRAGQPPLPS